MTEDVSKYDGLFAADLEVFSNQLLSIVEEMKAALIRSAYSPNIKERADCATAVLTPTGDVLAQTDDTPLHLGAMSKMVEEVMSRFGPDNLSQGDVFIGNDPFIGHMVHLNDVCVVAPAIDPAGRLIAFLATVAHHADLGGRMPGGESFDNQSIFEEGLRIPPIRVFHRNQVSDDVLALIALNSRNTAEVYGDLRAQFASCRLGVRRLHETFRPIGGERYQSLARLLLESSEQRFRAAVAELPDGTYEFTDYMDSNWAEAGPVPLVVSIEIEGSQLRLDVRNNVEQVSSARNVPYAMLLSTALYAIKAAVDPKLPPNSGYFRAVELMSTPGTIVHATPPAAVSVGGWTCQRLFDAIIGAFAQIDPSALAACGTTVFGMQLSGWDERTGDFFLDYERHGGGFGARFDRDGIDGIQVGITNTSNLPIEVAEAEYPIRVERYELVADSGGPGQFRGGMGIRRDIRVLVDGVTITTQGERFVVAPWGLSGGMPGRRADLILNPDTGDQQALPATISGFPLKRNDVISVRTAGGGGFGEPTKRSVAQVLQDVIDQKVSRESAERDYQVVVSDDENVDRAATKRLRG